MAHTQQIIPYFKNIKDDFKLHKYVQFVSLYIAMLKNKLLLMHGDRY